jgi:hypothetical protein
VNVPVTLSGKDSYAQNLKIQNKQLQSPDYHSNCTTGKAINFEEYPSAFVRRSFGGIGASGLKKKRLGCKKPDLDL